MSQTKKAAASKKGAAARAEVDPKPQTVEWQGLEIEIPAKLPDSILFDMVEVEASENPMPILRALRSMLGAEQFFAVRQKLESLGEDSDLEGLFGTIFEAYGLTLGES